MFSEEFRRRLYLGKYTRWAGGLDEDELEAVLWAVGEYGFRAHGVLECLDRHEGEFLPAHGYPRARLALGLISQMVEGRRFGLSSVIEQVQAVVAQWREQSSGGGDRGPKG